MEFSTSGAVHAVVTARAAGMRLQRFSTTAFREHFLARSRAESGVGVGDKDGGAQASTRHALFQVDTITYNLYLPFNIVI